MSEVPGWLRVDVSRETLDDLLKFKELVVQWSAKINLVSKGDLPFVMERHVWDSAQLVDLFEPDDVGEWLDLGSGGGFPGLVISIFAKHKFNRLQVTCVESDKRKCAFLRSAAQKLELDVIVFAERIEGVKASTPDIISARALASLSDLLDETEHLAGGNTKFLFPKGERWKEEIEFAGKDWHFDVKAHQSLSLIHISEPTRPY